VEALLIPQSVVILPIYAAREENLTGVSHTKLADAVNARGGKALALDSFQDAVSHIKPIATDADVVIVMGAGDITQVATLLTTP
jgi:UDP-N-acetylmuramate--alanine ligase